MSRCDRMSAEKRRPLSWLTTIGFMEVLSLRGCSKQPLRRAGNRRGVTAKSPANHRLRAAPARPHGEALTQESSMRIAPIIGGAGVVLASACAYHPTPIPLSGDPWTVHALTGEWTGTWFGTESGRSGTITFSMRAAGDSAFGDVLMAQPGGPPLVVAGDDPSRHRLHA